VLPSLLSQGVAFNQTRLFLILFCGTFSWQILLAFPAQYRYFKSKPARIFGAPPRLLGRFRLPSLQRSQFLALGSILIFSLLVAMCGFLPRLFMLVALASYFLYFNPIFSLASVRRKTNLIPMVMVVLLLAPGITAPLDQATSHLPLQLIQALVALMYFSAGMQKLRHSGIKWANGTALQAYLADHYLWDDNRSALYVAQRTRLCALLSGLVVFFELTFWIVLLLPQLVIPYFLAGIAFHLGAARTMRINYLKYLSPVYMVFVPQIAQQVQHALRA